LIVGVGGILGTGEKDVAVPFDAIKRTTRDGKAYPTMDAGKDGLKAAPGMRYDRNMTTWILDAAEISQSATPNNSNTGK
jgi:hypothetical protein